MSEPASSRRSNISELSMQGPITHAKNAIASDTIDMPFDSRAIYVGTAGDVKLITPAGSNITLKNLVAGIWHPIEVRRVFSTGTTALDIRLGW